MKKHNPSYTPWDGFIYKLDDPELMKELLDGLDVEDAEEAEARPVAKTKLKIKVIAPSPLPRYARRLKRNCAAR